MTSAEGRVLSAEEVRKAELWALDLVREALGGWLPDDDATLASIRAWGRASLTKQREDESREYERDRRRHQAGTWREKGDFGWYIAGYLLGEEVSEGGWFDAGGKRANWISPAQLRAVEKANFERAKAIEVALYGTGKDAWVEHQCGGCRWFGALNSDWGICCGEKSPQYGQITFEHTGCAEHSSLVRERGGA